MAVNLSIVINNNDLTSYFLFLINKISSNGFRAIESFLTETISMLINLNYWEWPAMYGSWTENKVLWRNFLGIIWDL